jgi:hypothetical protein
VGKRCSILVFLLTFSIGCLAQTPDDRCPSGSAFRSASTIEREISDFKVRVTKDGGSCRFEVRDASGRVIAADSGARVEALPEMYVQRIGTNDLVVETHSGGEHCCWTYFILNAVPAPRLVARISNPYPIDFIDYRGIELNDLVTRDGGFIDFESMPYELVPAPTVYIRFARGRPTNAGALFKHLYDQEIAQARARIKPDALEYFHSRNIYDDVELASNVLRIVLAYLYSGREEQAWKELAAMWPPNDLARIKSEILKARANGILRYTQTPP